MLGLFHKLLELKYLAFYFSFKIRNVGLCKYSRPCKIHLLNNFILKECTYTTSKTRIRISDALFELTVVVHFYQDFYIFLNQIKVLGSIVSSTIWSFLPQVNAQAEKFWKITTIKKYLTFSQKNFFYIFLYFKKRCFLMISKKSFSYILEMEFSSLKNKKNLEVTFWAQEMERTHS